MRTTAQSPPFAVLRRPPEGGVGLTPSDPTLSQLRRQLPVREQNRATREGVEAIKSQRIIEITNSKAGIKSKSAWQKLTLADWLEKFYAIQERKGIKRVEKLGSIIKIINRYGKSTRMGDIDKKWALGFIDWIQHTYTGRQGKPLEQ